MSVEDRVIRFDEQRYIFLSACPKRGWLNYGSSVAHRMEARDGVKQTERRTVGFHSTR